MKGIPPSHLADTRAQFLGMLQALGVEKLEHTRLNIGRLLCPEESREDRSTVLRSFLSHPHNLRALQSITMVMDTWESRENSKQAFGLLGFGAAYGNSFARELLVSMAKNDGPAREILNRMRSFHALAHMGWSLGFAQYCGALMENLFSDLAQMFRGNRHSPEEISQKSSHYFLGPYSVMRTLEFGLHDSSISKVENEQAEIIMHDLVAENGHTLLNLPDLIKRGRLALAQNVLSGVTRYPNIYIHSILSPYVVEAARLGVALSVLFPKNLRMHDGVDLQEVRLIFCELARNALKYRDPQRPEMKVEVRWDAETASFVIEDNGIGIANPSQIGQKGFRERRGEAEGTGLGLYSLRQRIERLNWKLTIASEASQWTRIHVIPKPGDVFEEE